MEQNQPINPGFIVVCVEDMNTQPEHLLRGLPASIEGLISALGLKADVIIPESVETSFEDEPGHAEEGAGDAGCSSLKMQDAMNQVTANLSDICLALLRKEYQSDTRNISNFYKQIGKTEHPIYVHKQWAGDVLAGLTDQGYWQWVGDRINKAVDLYAKMRSELKGVDSEVSGSVH